MARTSYNWCLFNRYNFHCSILIHQATLDSNLC